MVRGESNGVATWGGHGDKKRRENSAITIKTKPKEGEKRGKKEEKNKNKKSKRRRNVLDSSGH